MAFRSFRQTEFCRWEGLDGSYINGSLSQHYPGDSHRRKYEALILICDLASGTNLTAGGRLMMQIDKTEIEAFTEPPANQNIPATGVSRVNLTLCTRPMAADARLDPSTVRQWISFHRAIHSVASVILYNAGGANETFLSHFYPESDSFKVQIVDVRQLASYDSWEKARVLLANDCLYRSKSKSVWALFLDYDEYLTFPKKVGPQNLLELLAARPRAHWITFGTYVFSTKHCLRQETSSKDDWWAVENFRFRDREAYCEVPRKYERAVLCLHSEGLRTFVLNSNTVNVTGSNRVMNPARGGFHSPSSDVRVNKFKSMATLGKAACEFFWEERLGPPRFVRDDSVAEMAMAVRKSE